MIAVIVGLLKWRHSQKDFTVLIRFKIKVKIQRDIIFSTQTILDPFLEYNMAESGDNHAHSDVTISPDAKGTDTKSDTTQEWTL